MIGPLLRRARPASGGRPEPAQERPPRLVVRFALVTAISLGIGAAAILVFVRHLNTVEAERAAAANAQFVAETVLADELRAADFLDPVAAERRAELDELFARKVLRPGTVLVTLSGRGGGVTYATDHRLIGSPHGSAARAREALNGTVTSEPGFIADPAEPGGRLKVLHSYVPLTAEGRTGIAAIYQDYRPIESAARAALLPVAGILELVLIALFVLLVPLLVRVSRRLSRYIDAIRHQALHDDLTGLPNRPHFRDAVAGALAGARGEAAPVAVLVADVDRFQDVNDTLGHQAGDELLNALAARLRASLDDGALLARLGADEFGIVRAGLGATDAALLAMELRAALEEPFLVRDVPIAIEASVGVSVHPESGADAGTLLQAADAAMYAAKDRRAGVVVDDGTLDRGTTTALRLVSELRPALEREELVLHFQPQLELEGRRVVGAEALVRWEHPELGFLQPGAFMPFVERTSASRALSEYVLAHAARQLARWREAGLDLGVAVNLTMFDLLDTSLPGKVADVVERTEIEPHRLELEITESVIMADPARVREVVERLKAIGVRLAIDDFGTGYSSLSYLKTLPVDVLKIDRSFVMAMGASESDRAIVRSTIDLAHNLGLQVVAEGVDSDETLEELARYGCELAQGFHIARPCPAEEFASFVAASAAGSADRGEAGAGVA